MDRIQTHVGDFFVSETMDRVKRISVKKRLDQRRGARKLAEIQEAKIDERHVDFARPKDGHIFCYTSTGSPNGTGTLVPVLPISRPAKQLLDLPDELLHRILCFNLAFLPANRLQILLSCPKLHDVAISSKRDAAVMAIEAMDSLAVAMLPCPISAGWDPYTAWMPHLMSMITQIHRVIEEYTESRTDFRDRGAPPIPRFGFHINRPADYSNDLRHIFEIEPSKVRHILQIGLYMIGLLHFQPTHGASRPAQIIAFIHDLPSVALLLLRTTAILFTATLQHKYQLSVAVTSFLQATEMATFAETTMVVARVLLSRSITLPEDKYWSVDTDPFLKDLRESVRASMYCKSLGPGHSLYAKLTRNFYEVLLANRIEGEFEDLGRNCSDVDAMVIRINEWIAGRSNLEVLREIKTATGL